MQNIKELKKTNIPWMGEIPKYWKTYKLKYIGYMYSGLSGKVGDDFSKEENFNSYYIPFTSICNDIKGNYIHYATKI